MQISSNLTPIFIQENLKKEDNKQEQDPKVNIKNLSQETSEQAKQAQAK